MVRDRDIFAGANIEMDPGERVRLYFIGKENLPDAIQSYQGSRAIVHRILD